MAAQNKLIYNFNYFLIFPLVPHKLFLIFLSAMNKMMPWFLSLWSLQPLSSFFPYLLWQFHTWYHKWIVTGLRRIQMKSLIVRLSQPIYPHQKFLLPRYGFTGRSSSSRCSSLCVWERWRFSDVTRISIAAVFISQDIWLRVEISCSGWGKGSYYKTEHK